MTARAFRVLAFVLASAGAAAELRAAEPGPVTVVPIQRVREFPEATDPGAIQFACADRADSLAEYFRQAGLRFNRSLVHRHQEFPACHIYYEPTVQGFRASPESHAITALHASVDPMSFIVRRNPTGDSLDILKAVMPHLPKALDLTLFVSGEIDPSYWPTATRFHLSGLNQRLDVKSSGTLNTHPWAQDHMKTGEVNGKLRILTPRRLYQGRGDNEDLHRPFLDRMHEEVFARSKLSWEGGDLLIVDDPHKPGRRILIHGKASRLYWGQDLDWREISYVLLTEFGADVSVDLSQIGPHVDYLVAFLPADRIALVAEPVREDSRVIRAAVNELVRLYGDGASVTLRFLAERIAAWDGEFAGFQEYLRSAITALRLELPEFVPMIDSQLDADLDAYIEKHCSTDPDACFLGEGKKKMLREDPNLLRRASNLAIDIELTKLLAPRLLSLMEGQLPGAPPKHRDDLNATSETIRRLGFRVIRVPFLVSPDHTESWPGVSYVNLLSFERTLFVPALGLGEAEDQIFEDMRRKLAGGYRVMPVYARFSLVENGGVHCALGIVRAVTPAPQSDAPNL